MGSFGIDINIFYTRNFPLSFSLNEYKSTDDHEKIIFLIINVIMIKLNKMGNERLNSSQGSCELLLL